MSDEFKNSSLSDDKSRIEELKKRLFNISTKNGDLPGYKRSSLTPEEKESTNNWPESHIEVQERGIKFNAGKFFKYLFVFSIIFCILAAGISILLFITGYNRVSSGNIDVVIDGPVSIAGGEDLALKVTVQNKNRVTLKNVVLNIQYPDGTHYADDSSKALSRDSTDLDTIESGKEKDFTFHSVLFGEEGAQKNFTVTVDYKVAGSETIYPKEKTFSLELTKAPISLLLKNPTEVNSGQEISFDVSAVSNSRANLSDVLLKVQYPFGFTLTGSSLPNLQGTQDTWNLGMFKPGDTRKITIKGILEGENEEDRAFKFTLGSMSPKDERQILTAYTEQGVTLSLKKPFIGAKIFVGGETKDGAGVATLGHKASGNINFRNNLPTSLTDVTVELVPKGEFFDRNTLEPTGGFYKSNITTLYWDKFTNGRLREIKPGASESVSFKFTTFSLETLKKLYKNPQMQVDAVIRGKTVRADGSLQDVYVNVSKKIRFTTSAGMNTEVLRSTGPFTNYGPYPPKAENKTSYTVRWNLFNTSNALTEGQMTVSIPIYVQWLGNVSPKNEDIKFNPDTRTITWKVPQVNAYAGYNGSAPQSASFQVEIFPSISQAGQMPEIVSGGQFQAVDRFTDSVLKLNTGNATTNVVGEPGSAPGRISR